MDVAKIDEELLNGDYDHFDNFEEIVAMYKAQVSSNTLEPSL